MVAASEQPKTRLCSACFDGKYPIALPDEARIGKHLLEGRNGSKPAMLPVLPAGYGAEEALQRP